MRGNLACQRSPCWLPSPLFFFIYLCLTSLPSLTHIFHPVVYFVSIQQYTASIDPKKLSSSVRTLLPAASRLPAKNFELKVAKEPDSDRLTGFTHNSVSPYGTLSRVPIIVSAALKEEVSFMYMGGGDVDLKVGASVEEFVRSTEAFVLDVSNPKP